MTLGDSCPASPNTPSSLSAREGRHGEELGALMLIDDPLQEGNIWSGGKSIFLSQSFTISWITEHWEDMKQAISHPLRKVHISALGFGIRFLSAFPFLLVSVPHLSRRNCSCYSVCNASKCCQSDAVGTCDPICSIREVHFPGPTVSARDT